MINNKIYTNKEIKNLMQNINELFYIGDEDYKIEKYKQISLNGEYIPYIISSYGRIFSINYAGKKHNVKQLKTKISNAGYERITITYRSMVLSLSIHRLVATAFIYKHDNIVNSEVNHIDGNKLNNNLENLEWVTPVINVSHAFDKGLRKCGEHCSNSKYKTKQITDVCEMLVNDFKIKDIINKTGVKEDTIKDIMYKRSWTHISSKYDFSKYHYGISHKEYMTYINNIHNTCRMIEENFTLKYIKEKTGFTMNQISKILHKRTNTDISNSYDFSQYNYGKPYNYKNKIHEVCKYGECGEYTIKQISEMVGLSYRNVQHILHGDTHKEITKKYNLEKYKIKS